MTTQCTRHEPHPKRLGAFWRRLALVAGLLTAAGSAAAATFLVNNRFDAGTGGCTAAECTLREAIVAANATAAADTINFDIPIPIRGEILIQPATPLPTITQPVVINGYSQNGTAVNTDPVASNAVIRIRVDGLNVAASVPGFAICADNVTLKGLSITRFVNGIGFGTQATGNNCSNPISGGAAFGNFVGLASNGTTAAGNTTQGLSSIQAQITVGSGAPADRNVIGSNGASGVHLFVTGSSNSSVLGNLIGTDRTGTLNRGNGFIGVDIDADAASVTVGSATAPNRIAFNSTGARVRNTLNNRLFANHYGPNNGLGIDLLDATAMGGVSLNDSGDGDGGGNGQQNYLDDGFTADRTPNGINIQGTLRRIATTPVTFTIAAYATPACDASFHGEGEQFLGTATQVTSAGTAPINVNIPLATQPPAGSFITTTITSLGGSTSEFSTCAALDPPPLVVNSTNDVADGLCNAAHCSLRDAIIAANADPEPKIISFNITSPASGELMIQPTTALPTITAPVTIDGYLQPGTSVNLLGLETLASNAVLRVRVDGLNAGLTARGLAVCADDVTIRGLSVTRFGQAGIAFGVENNGQACPAPINGGFAHGNCVGLASDCLTAAGNSSIGIFVGSGNLTIGSTAAADRNVIGSNSADAIFVQGAAVNGSSVLGNLIGTNKGGLTDRGNGSSGINFNNSATGVSVGSVAAPNLIRFNREGILTIANDVTGLIWTANHIFGNDQEGIDFGDDGVTLNLDGTDDADTGPNGLQNFPVITQAERSDAGIAISGTLDVKVGTSNVPYTIGVYANTACDAPSGHGEGERLLGAATVNLTQTSGESFSFALTTNDPLEAGVQITTTATGPEGSSEFSLCVAATDAPLGIAVNSAADLGAGTCNGSDECTLRQAITLANAQVGADLIRFEIPGDGPHDIALAGLLPVITEALTIDGYTQDGASENAADPEAGSDAVLKIQVNGQNATTHLLRTCTSGSVEVRGLALVRATTLAIATRTLNSGFCSVPGGALIVKGTHIGVGLVGTNHGNGGGIQVFDTVATIGGSEPADRNILSNAVGIGLAFAGPGSNGSTVQNNLIGTGADPAVDLGNGGTGVLIANASNVTLGGEGRLANLIAFNGRGVDILGNNIANGHRLYANEYVANDGLGIDLSVGNTFNGVTPNDLNDPDVGPNNLQNFPVLSDGAATASSITVNGTLDVPAGIVNPLVYTLAFYESAACDASGNGEGEIYLGSRQVNFTSAAENFSETFTMSPSAGASVITATATDPDGNTSEFSNCLTGPRPVQIFADGFE